MKAIDKNTYLKQEIKISVEKFDNENNIINGSTDICNYFRNIIPIDINTQECFTIIYLDKKSNVIGYNVNSIGGIDQSIVDVRLIFTIALKCLATSIICIHNHPSGNLTPSSSDIQVEKQIKKVAEYHNISCLDFLIVTENGDYSFEANK